MCTPSSTVYKSTDKVYASNNLHLFLLGLSRCSYVFFFFADDGISIPCEYTSFLAPIAAPKLHFEVAQSNDSGKGPSVILHATLKTLRSRGVFSILCPYNSYGAHKENFRHKQDMLSLMIVSDILITLTTYVSSTARKTTPVLNRLSAQPRISAHPLTI